MERDAVQGPHNATWVNPIMMTPRSEDPRSCLSLSFLRACTSTWPVGTYLNQEKSTFCDTDYRDLRRTNLRRVCRRAMLVVARRDNKVEGDEDN